MKQNGNKKEELARYLFLLNNCRHGWVVPSFMLNCRKQIHEVSASMVAACSPLVKDSQWGTAKKFWARIPFITKPSKDLIVA